MIVRRTIAMVPFILLLICLSAAAPARAQTTEEPRVGVGVTVSTGIGVGGGALLPFKDVSAGSLGVVIAGGFQRGSNTTDEFGGGLRFTHPLNAKARVFVQGTVSLVQMFFNQVNSHPAYAGGGGVSIAVNERVHFLAEGDLGVRDGRKVGLLFFGISVPIRKH